MGIAKDVAVLVAAEVRGLRRSAASGAPWRAQLLVGCFPFDVSAPRMPFDAAISEQLLAGRAKANSRLIKPREINRQMKNNCCRQSAQCGQNNNDNEGDKYFSPSRSDNVRAV